MNIGIVQVDGKIPNLALMKIAGYHKNIGDNVEWFNGMLFSDQYDKVYASKIFEFSDMPQLPSDAIIGGTGIDFYNMLPREIEESTPIYDLYPKWGSHIGFSMKGCRFNCSFCCVPKKEGRPKEVGTLSDIMINPHGGPRVMLLDNDFFGNPNWESFLADVKEKSAKVCFAQGLNIRIITDEQAKALADIKYTNTKFNQKYVTFAWDKIDDEKLIMDGIDRCENAGIPGKNMQFFVLIGYDTTPEQDYHRIMKLSERGALPFVMPYNRANQYQKSFARWVNNRAVFRSTSWKDYKYNQH